MSWDFFKYTDFYPKYWPILANFPKKSVLQTKSIFTDLIVITGIAPILQTEHWVDKQESIKFMEQEVYLNMSNSTLSMIEKISPSKTEHLSVSKVKK